MPFSLLIVIFILFVLSLFSSDCISYEPNEQISKLYEKMFQFKCYSANRL